MLQVPKQVLLRFRQFRRILAWKYPLQLTVNAGNLPLMLRLPAGTEAMSSFISSLSRFWPWHGQLGFGGERWAG